MEVIENKRNRIKWVDCCRSFAMTFVMILHFSNGLNSQWVYSAITAPLMIPVFFAITGFVFNDCNGDFKLFSYKSLKSIIIPWLSLSIIKALVVSILRTNPQLFVDHIVGLFTGANLWYFPCFIIAIFIQFFLRRISKEWLYCFCSICLSIIGLSLNHSYDYLNYQTALIAQSFFLLGFAYKRHSSFFEKYKLSICFGGILVYSILSIISIRCFPNQYIDVHLDQYFFLPINILMVGTGVLTLFCIMSLLDSYIPKLLTVIGSSTLVIYIFHYDTVYFLDKIVAHMNLSITSWLLVMVKYIWAMIICLGINTFCSRFVPVLIGKKPCKEKDRVIP